MIPDPVLVTPGRLPLAAMRGFLGSPGAVEL